MDIKTLIEKLEKSKANLEKDIFNLEKEIDTYEKSKSKISIDSFIEIIQDLYKELHDKEIELSTIEFVLDYIKGY